MYNHEEWIQQLKTEWQDKKVAVWGAGRSGQSAARLLCTLGASVILSDPNPECTLSFTQEDYPTLTLCLGQANVLGTAE